MSNMQDLLRTTTARDILKEKKRRMVMVRSSDPLKSVLSVLQEHEILGAAVLDELSGTIIGFVDVLDVAGYVLRESKKMGYSLEDTEKRHACFNTPVANLINFSSVDFPVTVDDDISLLDLVGLFCHRHVQSRLHRVAVRDFTGIYNVLTQTDVVRWMYKHRDDLRPLMDEPIKKLVQLRTPVMVRLDDPFSAALETLYSNRVSGIALVDDNGRISGNLSASDLRGLTPSSFDHFTGSTLQFLVKDTASPLLPPITCHEDTPLHEVIEQVCKLHIHRIYIVSEEHNQHPIGLISLVDIIALINTNK